MAANRPAHTYPIPENRPTYNIYTEPSPASSASPASPRMHEYSYAQRHPPNPYKQIRPLKSPLYIPAVLRPTEHFSSPATPPKSQHGSLDNLQNAQRDLELEAAQAELDYKSLHQGWLDEEDLGDVTGPPTTEHWKPDNASPSCDSPQCRSNFNLFVRKHHCRHCGHIFCATHVTRMIPLDQSAKFHPDGVHSRACETCYRQYQKWDTARSLRRRNSQTSKDDVNDESGPPTPLAGPASHRRMISAGSGMRGKPTPELANSVPKDWAWSTF